MVRFFTSSVAVSDAWLIVVNAGGWWVSTEGHFGDGSSVRLVREVEFMRGDASPKNDVSF